MAAKILNLIPILILTMILIPMIAAYCLLWAIMTLGGGFVKRIFKKTQSHN